MSKTARISLILPLLLSIALPAVPQQPAAKSTKATLADFAWLAGQWRGQTQGPNRFTAEEFWADAQGGAMMGMFRLLDPANGNRVLILEFFTLRETPDGVEMRIRPFDAALVLLEKEDSIILKLAESDGPRFTFQNPVHARPKRGVLARVGADAFTWRAEFHRDTGETNLVEVSLERVVTGAGAPKGAPAMR
jgi:hypothetical protein